MPIYEFKCKKCHREFETLVSSQKFKDISCPQCQSQKVEKLMSVFGGVIVKNHSLCSSEPACQEAGECGSGGSCPMKSFE